MMSQAYQEKIGQFSDPQAGDGHVGMSRTDEIDQNFWRGHETGSDPTQHMSNTDEDQPKYLNELIAMGFSEDLSRLVLESSAPDAPLHELVAALSDMQEVVRFPRTQLLILHIFLLVCYFDDFREWNRLPKACHLHLDSQHQTSHGTYVTNLYISLLAPKKQHDAYEQLFQLYSDTLLLHTTILYYTILFCRTQLIITQHKRLLFILFHLVSQTNTSA